MTVVCMAGLASCASPPTDPTNIPVSASSDTDNALSSRLFRDVNAYRRSQGGQELQRHRGLDKLAQSHSEYLLKHRGSFSLKGKNVSHFGFDGRSVIAREQLQMSNFSENVATSPNARDILPLWKTSKDHQKNMLDNWTHSGIGVAVDSDGMVFATQLFSTQNYSQRSTRERFNRF